jgi:eukaryotic-like serine/threonine-protein kinase
MGPGLLAGRYRLDRVLGSGGTGTVWLGFDTKLTRAVAVKELRLPATIDDLEAQELVDRVMVEAQSAARVDHPNVVKVYEILTESGKPWLVLQLVHGPTLAQRLKAGPLTIDQAVTVGLAVVEALAASHALGIIHRDVKPANVLLADNGQVLLTDFSIAKVIGPPGITGNSNIWGTPGYVAPELVKNWTPGPPSDLFGLGVLLFRAVEGYGPFDRGDPEAAMLASVTEPHPRPAHAGPLTQVIDGLLEKDPMARLTVEGTRSALNAIARPEPAPIPYPPPVPAPIHHPPLAPAPPANHSKPPKPRRTFGVRTVSLTVTISVALTVALTLKLMPQSTGNHPSIGAASAPPDTIITTASPSSPPTVPTNSVPSITATTTPPSSPIIATQPFLNVNKAAVQNGGQVVINGGGFKPGEIVYVDFWWGGVSNLYQMAKPVANAAGKFGPIYATIRQGQPGPSNDYSIDAKGATSSLTASAPISIEAS